MDLDFIHYFELLIAVLAIVYYKKYTSSFYKYFILYTCCAFLVEFIAEVFLKGTNNWWLYNLYTFVEFNLVALIYYHLTKEKKSHRIIFYIVLLFNITYLISFIFIALQNYTPILLGVLVSVFIFLYLKELLNSNKIVNFRKDISFWITIGFLIYYLATIPFFTLLFVVGMKDRILFYILQGILVITHLIFIVGLLCSKKTVK